MTTPQGYAAFVPAPLPPALDLGMDLVRELSRADAALAGLSALGRQLPNPRLLVAPWLRREAVLSSRIEGTRATLSDVLIDELAGDTVPRDAAGDVREVRNYVEALEYGLGRLKTLPLSLRLVRELHERLMTGVRGNVATPGEFRRSQNFIGPPGGTLESAVYVPPPVAEMHEALRKWEAFLHVRDEFPDLIQCALMHEHFEAIHPFLDGNGRIGRLLVTLFLVERGRLSQPLLYLSDYIDATRGEYYELLQRVRTHGDWRAWIRYFLAGVAAVSESASAQAGKLLALRETLRARLAAHPRAVALIDELVRNPYIHVAQAERLLGVSNPTARSAVNALVKEGVLEEITKRSWGKLYVARPVLAIIQGPEG
ncbi:MAG TPA: Fic family protein [Usitatibacteraceae bacterium]|nr:Fic family protein [Usitatibacteraceae bacterium]